MAAVPDEGAEVAGGGPLLPPAPPHRPVRRCPPPPAPRPGRVPSFSTFQSQPRVLSADSPRPLSSGVVRACFALRGGGGITGAPGALPRHEARWIFGLAGRGIGPASPSPPS